MMICFIPNNITIFLNTPPLLPYAKEAKNAI